MIKTIKRFTTNCIGLFPMLFAVIMTAKTLGFNLGPIDLVSYVALIIAAVTVLYKGIATDTLSLILILYIPIALLISQPPPVFASWGRFGLFVLLFTCTSPLINTDFAKEFRNKVLKGVLFCCTMISVISFFCYFLGINYMRLYDSSMDYREVTAGTFGGITSQSMLLGPISGISVLACSYMALVTNHKKYWLFAVFCAGSMLFTASRSTLVATITGILVLFLYFSNRGNLMVRKLVLVILLVAAFYPLWNGAMTGLTEKNRGDMLQGLDYSSREQKWTVRIDEFKSSPLLGIGFGAVSEKDSYDHKTGIIEPGSSWLAVLSMTGALGFVIFSCIFFRGFKHTILSEKSPQSALLGALLTLVGVHMLAEGHVFSAGSFLCFLVWLIIGCSTDYKTHKEFLQKQLHS